jgi:hypothetical protein
MFYIPARVEQSEPYSIFHMSDLTMMLERSQAVSSRRNDDSQINVPSWVLRKTHASLAPQV